MRAELRLRRSLRPGIGGVRAEIRHPLHRGLRLVGGGNGGLGGLVLDHALLYHAANEKGASIRP